MFRNGLRQWAAVRRMRGLRTRAVQKPASPPLRISTIATRSAKRPSGSAPTSARAEANDARSAATSATGRRKRASLIDRARGVSIALSRARHLEFVRVAGEAALEVTRVPAAIHSRANAIAQTFDHRQLPRVRVEDKSGRCGRARPPRLNLPGQPHSYCVQPPVASIVGAFPERG